MGDIVRQRGFTLAELLIVVVIVAILAGIGVPAFRDLVLSNRQASGVNELVTALQLARSEAVTRNISAPAVVSVCASANGQNCGGTWSDGWIVFTDSDATNGVDVDEVLRVADAPSGLAITAPGLGAAVSYRRDGRALGSVDFVFCDSRGASSARVIQLGLSGRPSISKYRADGSVPVCGG